ncbi:MAG: magnesium transporter CorA family protein [Planctomycetota bacterium]
MHVLHFAADRMPPSIVADLAAAPGGGLLWIDLMRSEAANWFETLRPILQVDVDVRHQSDSLNPEHASFFDGTGDYDMLIFEGLGPTESLTKLETRTAALFLFENAVVSVRDAENVSFRAAIAKLLEGRARIRTTPLALAYVVLDTMIDRYLDLRDRLDREMTELQDALLDPANPMNDWLFLLQGRRVARRLETLSGGQGEAIDCWRRSSRFQWTDTDEVRARDLEEHIRRVSNHASNLEHDIESAVQLHFASVAHRTNRVIQILTVVSVIFFPMTLITGIYGMNFDDMPGQHSPYGFLATLAALPLIAGVLLLLFRRRGWF